MMIMTIIRCKTPPFYDVFEHRTEMVLITRPCLIAIFYIVAALAIRGILTAEMQPINQLIVHWVTATLSAWIVYVTTIDVVKRNTHWLELQDDEENNQNMVYQMAQRSLADTSSGTLEKTDKVVRMRKESVIGDKNAFEMLLFHSAQVTLYCSKCVNIK